MRFCPLPVLVLLLCPLAVTAADTKDGGSIQGTWVPSSAELGGKMFPDKLRKGMTMVLQGDDYAVKVEKGTDKGTVKLNLTAMPKEMDITGTDGPNKGKTFLAIFERDGDTLRVCYDLSGKSRPTEFKSPEGTECFLVTYKLEK